MSRIEIDHLTTLEACNSIKAGIVGLGYNSGSVSYYWEISKVNNGSIVVTIERALTLTASTSQIAASADLPICRFVASLVQAKTGNCADTLCNLLGQ